MAFDAGSIEAHLTATRDEFDKVLDQAKADAAKWAKDPIKATITADGDQAKTVMTDLSARKDKLGKDTSFKLAADAGTAKTELDAVQAKKDKAGQDVSFRVSARDDATAALARVQAEKDKVGGDVTVKVKTESDTSGLDDIGKKITELKDGPFSLLKTAIVGLGPAALPVAGSLVAAFAPLAPAIGSSVIGLEAFGQIAKLTLTSAGTAAAAVYKAQNTYNTAIASGTKQATAYATEQKAIATAYAGMSAQQITLSKQVGVLETGWRSTLKAVTPLVSSALVPWMKDVQQLLQYIKPLIAPIATDFQAWGQELGKALDGNQAKIKSFIDLFAARSAGNIASFGDALISFAKGAGSLIHDIAPELGGAANGIAGLAASFAGWASSKQAADDIRAFFTWARAETPVVRQFLDSLTGSVGNLIKALSYSGGGDLRVLTTALQGISALPSGAIVAIADAYVAISVGLRAASAGMAVWKAAAASVAVVQAALNTETKATGAALALQKIATLAAAAADAVVDAAETIYIALMLAADAASLPLIVVIGAIVLAVAALSVGIYELVTHWSTAWHAILAAADAVWSWIKGNWPLLAAILLGPIAVAALEIYEHWQTIENDAKAVFGAIASFFSNWWSSEVADWTKELDSAERIFSSAWSSVSSAAKSAWGAIASFFSNWWQSELAGWRNTISTFTGFFRAAWGQVESDAKSAYSAIKSFFSNWWTSEVAGWRAIIATVTGIFRNAWSAIYGDIKSEWGQIKSWFGSFWSSLESGFTTVVARIKSIWKGFQADISAPVTWVVNNVYDKYIVRFWNDVAGAVGLAKLPALAEGGIVPGGYSPVDNQLVWMRSGEGVLQPGAVAALGGEPFINWANSTYGDLGGGQNAPGHFQFGGIFHDIGSLLSSPIREVLSIGKTLEHAVDDGILAPFKAITRIMVADLAKMPGAKDNGMVSIMQKMPLKMWDGFVSWVGNHLPFASSSGGGASGPGSAKGNAITQFAEQFLGTPYVWGGTSPQGWDCCILWNMEVQTSRGPKQIVDVLPGDEVYSWDDGKLNIGRVVRRSNPRKQMTYRLRTNHREIVASGNHPFLTLRHVSGEHECEDCGRTVRNSSMKCGLHTPCSDCGRPVDNGRGTRGSRGLCMTDLARRKRNGTLPPWRGPGRPQGSCVTEWVNLEDLRLGDTIVALRSLSDDNPAPDDEYLSDPEFLWLLGFAIGDGNLYKGRRNRIDLSTYGETRELVHRKLTAYCGKPGTATAKNGIYLFHAGLAEGLRRYGLERKSPDRVVPAEVWTLPHGHIRAFLDGYTAADGSISKRERDLGAISYNTASEGLARGLRNLHMILGHNVGRLRKQERTKPIFIKGIEVKNAKPLWSFQAYVTGKKVEKLGGGLLTRAGVADLFPSDSHFTPQRVLSIEPLTEDDTYDITVEGTHNFIAEGLVVHNSGFTEFVYDHFGWTPPRTSEEQFGWVKRIADPVPGALAFFAGSPIDPPPGHVGIVTSPDTMIDAYGTGYGTIYNTINGSSGTVMGFGIPPSGFKFDNGGWLQPGATMVVNTTGKPEPVLTGDQWNVLSSAAGSGALGDKLDRIANLLSAGPRATGAATGEVVNGSAHSASFRSRYPRNR